MGRHNTLNNTKHRTHNVKSETYETRKQTKRENKKIINYVYNITKERKTSNK